MGCEYGLPTSENTCALDDALTLAAIQLDQILETANKVPTKPSREVQSSSRNRADGPDSLSASKLESESLSRTQQKIVKGTTQVSCKPNDWSHVTPCFVDTLQAIDKRGNNGLPDVSAVASSDVGITSPAQVY